MRSTDRSFIRCAAIRGLLLIGVVAALAVPGAGAGDDPFLVQLQDLIDTIELAMYYAKAALLASDPLTFDTYLDEAIALLVAPGGAAGSQSGLDGRIAALVASLGGIPVDGPTEAEIAASLESASAFATLALEELDLLGSADPASDVGRMSAVRRLLAFLSAARGGIPFSLPGLVDVRTSLPNAERTAGVGDVLQDHLDALLPGGILYLEPGTYEIAAGLVIDKSMTVQPTPGAAEPVVLALGPDHADAVLSICTTTPAPIHVTLRDLTVRGGTVGVSVGQLREVVSRGAVAADLENVEAAGSARSGVRLGLGELALTDCRLADNGVYGLIVPWSGAARLVGCTIERNGAAGALAADYLTPAGIYVTGRGSVEIRSCDVTGNAGVGVWAAETAAIRLHSSRIRDNAEDGIQLWGRASLSMRECVVSGNLGFGVRLASEACGPTAAAAHRFMGEVDGFANSILDDSDVGGNQRGAVCPGDYTFLTEGAQTD